jgi:hypothetical protein
MTDTSSAAIYGETGTVTTTSPWTSGSLFDVGVGLKVYKNLTLGAAYHQEQNDTDTTLSGSIPSPIIFNRPRTLAGTESLNRKEQGTHLVIGWVMPFSSKLDVMVFGGPSFFRLNQEVLSVVTPNENSVSGNSIGATSTISERKQSVTGFNAGVDATYIVWSNDSVRIGAGGFVRMTQASTDVQMLDAGSKQPTDVGGVQFGFGARIRF